MKYDKALDGIRAVGVAAVVIFHFWPHLMPGGWAGVDVFFVLSGFLITNILRAEHTVDGHLNLFRFFSRRSLRLLPALWALLAVSLALSIVSRSTDSIFAIGMAGSYLMNWNRAFEWGPQSVLGHTWSLAMEEQFYLIWPFMLMLIVRHRPLLVIVLLTAVVVAWRSWLALNGADPERTYNGFDTHADALLIGCALAFSNIETDKPRPLLAMGSSAILIAIFFFLPYKTMWTQTLGLAVTALAAASVIVAVQSPGILRSMISISPVVFVGRISYGIYLWHYPVLLYGSRYTDNLAVLLVLSVLIAVASYYVIERPFLKLKDSTSTPASFIRALHPLIRRPWSLWSRQVTVQLVPKAEAGS